MEKELQKLGKEGWELVSVCPTDSDGGDPERLTAFLKKAGVARIEHACDGGEALAELDLAAKAGRPFDFIFSDLWMPHMNGMEFIEKLRADARLASIPVFALTADTEFRRDARIKLFTGTLLKPLTFAKLLDAFNAMNRA